MHWIWLIIVGAVVGALGRLFHPGRDPMGWIVTILIGIASLVIAGLIFSNGVLEFVVGIIVAVWWAVSAKHKYTGPVRTIETDELGRVIEEEPPATEPPAGTAPGSAT